MALLHISQPSQGTGRPAEACSPSDGRDTTHQSLSRSTLAIDSLHLHFILLAKASHMAETKVEWGVEIYPAAEEEMTRLKTFREGTGAPGAIHHNQ